MESLTKKILFGLGTIVFTLVAINRLFFFSSGYLEKISTAVTYPIIKISAWASTTMQTVCERKLAYAQLEEKYAILKEAYLATLAQNMQLKATIHYDNLSKELRDFQERYNLSHMMLAKILVKNITDDEHYFLVNKGLKQGIKKDMTAIYKFQLIGRVTDVFDDYAQVLLITDQRCKVAAYTSQTSSQGIVQGQNIINRCSMNYVSHLFKIVDHDLVISSGKGLVFPEGFCLGKITSHEIQDKALDHTIELEPLINMQALEYCLLTDHSGFKQSSQVTPTVHPACEKYIESKN